MENNVSATSIVRYTALNHYPATDADALRKAAHGMKSSSANVGAERLAALCKELEMIGRSGTIEEDARPLLKSADQELLRVLQALMDEHATTSRK